MKTIHFKPLDPEDIHTCNHCSNLHLDISEGKNRYFCSLVRNIEKLHYPNDCEQWGNPFIIDKNK